MKSLNLSGSQAEIVVKSLHERLNEFDEELDVLESRIIEIRMKKSQLNNLLGELGGIPLGDSSAPKKRGRKPGSGKKAASATASAEPKKRGRKPGSGKKAAAATASAEPKKRGRKPGSGKKAAAKTAIKSATPGKRGRKPGSGKKVAAKAAVKAAPAKRGPKPGKKAKTAAKAVAPKAAPTKRGPKPGKKAAAKTAVKAAAPKIAPAKRGPKPGKKASAGKEAVQAKVSAIAPAAPAKKAAAKAAPAKAAPAKSAPAKSAPKKEATPKADADSKRGRKSGGENTLAAKIVNSIKDAKKGLSTREIVDAINTKYGAEKDERKLIQAISSTLISLTKRGKIKRENTSDGQILNNVV